MNDQAVVKPNWGFWLIVVLSLFWYAMSCMNFIWQMDITPEKLAVLSEAQKALIEDRPIWVTIGFGIAAFAGTAGCLLLLFKRSAALYFLLLSLIGVIVAMVPVYGVAHAGVSFTVFEFSLYVIATPLLGLFLVWYAKYAKRNRWLR